MFEGNLSDLEELVLSVRDRNSRDYIGEAVANYRSRCYRSAITSTWVALTYDIISKIRELSLQGDNQAKVFIDRVDRAIALRVASPTDSKKQLQTIEGELLTIAYSQFEFFTDHELRDMERLRDDRNMCSHPALAGEGHLFQPSPELVRTHIVHAISNLLLHPPVQGKSALLRLKSDLQRPSFPTSQTSVSEFLDERYLKHIKSGLVDNLVTILLKVVINQSEPDLIGKEDAILMTLIAIQRRFPDRVSERMRQDLPRICDGCDEDALCRTMLLFRVERRCWNWLGQASQKRVIEIIRSYEFDAGNLRETCSCLKVDELRPHFAARVTTFSQEQKQLVFAQEPDSIFIEDAIELYSRAQGFRSAESLFETMVRPFIGTYRTEHIQSVLSAAMENGQIYCASKTCAQLVDLFDGSLDLIQATAESWRSFLLSVRKKYDEDGRIYSVLQKRMTDTGIWNE